MKSLFFYLKGNLSYKENYIYEGMYESRNERGKSQVNQEKEGKIEKKRR